MLAAFREFLETHTDHRWRTYRYLLGVSGGLDSMTMLELCRQLQLDCGVVTVNYGLRPEAAAEMELVQRTALRAGFPCSVSIPDMQAQSGNLQDNARRIRLDLLRSVLTEQGYDWIVLANHADDLVETMLIRQLQGRHPLLWGGFAACQGKVLRPFIKITRDRIRDWAQQAEVAWLEDSSNRSDAYLRNRIRHHLLPLMTQLAGRDIQTRLQKNTLQLRQTRELLDELMARESARCLLQQGSDRFVLDKELFQGYTSTLQRQLIFLLVQRLTDWHFTPGEQLLEVLLLNLKQRSGGMRIGRELLLRHNAAAILLAKVERQLPVVPLSKNGHIQRLPGTGVVTCREVARKEIKLTRDNQVEFLSLPPGAACHFRPWRRGDSYLPLGRRKSRKVADLLSSRGILDRTASYLLVCDGKIAWIVGQSMAADFRVDNTGKVYKMQVVENETC